MGLPSPAQKSSVACSANLAWASLMSKEGIKLQEGWLGGMTGSTVGDGDSVGSGLGLGSGSELDVETGCCWVVDGAVVICVPGTDVGSDVVLSNVLNGSEVKINEGAGSGGRLLRRGTSLQDPTDEIAVVPTVLEAVLVLD